MRADRPTLDTPARREKPVAIRLPRGRRLKRGAMRRLAMARTPATRRGERGFTLIEPVVSTVRLAMKQP
jgi:hypothetical protein